MASKSSKSIVVKLRLPSSALAKFEPSPQSSKKSSARSKSTPTSTSTSTPSNQPVEPAPEDIASESNNATPAPNSDATPTPLAPPATTLPRKKGIPGPKPGSKRSLGATIDGQPKPRGKPGPKKKPRLEGDPALAKGPFAGVVPIATQKLGPRANQGAINAGLRALDRSGKPCRKWEKKGFSIKSFTGVQWGVPTWRAPRKVKLDENGDVKSDTTSVSDTKPVNESSAVSEKSNGAEAVDGTVVVQPSATVSLTDAAAAAAA